MPLRMDVWKCVLGLAALAGVGLQAVALAGQAAPGGTSAGAGDALLAQRAAQDEQTAIDAVEQGFRNALTREMTPAERVQVLERLAKEHPDSKWADDALWVLGEAARQQGLAQRVVYYWQYLIGSKPDVELEEFTRSQELYRRSGLAQAAYYLQATGLNYLPQEGMASMGGTYFVNAKPFNAVPMFVWDGLAHAYQDLGRPKLALKAYRKALECAPAAGPWTRSYLDRVETLQASLNSQNAAPQPAASASTGLTPSPAAEAATATPSASPAGEATYAPAQEARASGRTGSD